MNKSHPSIFFANFCCWKFGAPVKHLKNCLNVMPSFQPRLTFSCVANLQPNYKMGGRDLQKLICRKVL